MKTNSTGHKPTKPALHYICTDCGEDCNAHPSHNRWWGAVEAEWNWIRSCDGGTTAQFDIHCGGCGEQKEEV